MIGEEKWTDKEEDWPIIHGSGSGIVNSSEFTGP